MASVRMLYREKSAGGGWLKELQLYLTLAWTSHRCAVLVISRFMMVITLGTPPSDFLPAWPLLRGLWPFPSLSHLHFQLPVLLWVVLVIWGQNPLSLDWPSTGAAVEGAQCRDAILCLPTSSLKSTIPCMSCFRFSAKREEGRAHIWY